MHWSRTWFDEFFLIMLLSTSLSMIMNSVGRISFLEARGKSSKVVITLHCLCEPMNHDVMLWKYVWYFYVYMLGY